jgi:hypothetical protein
MIENFTFIKRAGLPRHILFRIAKELGISSNHIFSNGNFYRIVEEAARRSAAVRHKNSAKNIMQRNNYDLPKQKPQAPQTPPTPKKPEGPEQLEFDF